MNCRKLAVGMVAVGLVVASLVAGRAVACPGCNPEQTSFGQDIKAGDVALIAELVELPPGVAEGDAFPPGLGEPVQDSKFRIVEVLKGTEHVKKIKFVETPYFGSAKVGTPFLVRAIIDSKEIIWMMPVELSKRSRQYILDGMKLPDGGPDRLAFFLKYLEDEDEILRRDSYDEFAYSSYDDLKALAPRLPHAELLARLKNPEIVGNRRRLYFTMIGAIASKDDIPFLESILRSKDRKEKEGLDAIIGCYLAISGPAGLKLLEDEFFKQNDDFTTVHFSVLAVRIAEESGTVKKADAAVSFRTLLDNPKMADYVIPDLARWEDWSVIDRISELFVKSKPEDWIRGPVLRYLHACPLPEAKKQLARLEKIDPEAAKRAAAFLTFPSTLPGGGAKAPAGSKSAADTKETKKDTDKTTAGKSEGLKSGKGS